MAHSKALLCVLDFQPSRELFPYLKLLGCVQLTKTFAVTRKLLQTNSSVVTFVDLSVFEFGRTLLSSWSGQSKMKDGFVNSVDPDGTAPSHQDLSGFTYLLMYMQEVQASFGSLGLI